MNRRKRMKRTISILVIVAMMLASVLAIVPASAAETPEGTAINSAADFAAMDAAGTYYLAADITLTEMYSKANFTGTLDGNGKTITLSGIPTAIKEMKGATVSNLKLVVDYTFASSAAGGALSHWANGTFTNITVDAKYTIPEGFDMTTALGALFTEINGSSTLTNCVTNGTISILNNSTKDGQDGGIRYNSAGGITGKLYTAKEVKFINCVNNVDIVNTQTNVSNGGFIGGVESQAQLYFENCVNNGDVSGTATNHMGISGFVGILGPNSSTTTTFKNCRNNGNLTDLGTTGHQNAYMGGFVGRNYGSPKITIENSINAGDVTSSGGGWSGAGGFVGNGMTHGYSWTVSAPGIYTFKNCINLGNVTGAQFSGGIGGGFKQHSAEGSTVQMENCANFGDIEGKEYAGGMLGQVGDYGCDIVILKNCYNAGDITAPNGAAGMAGYIQHGAGSETKADGYNIVNRSPMVIDNCANVGTITCNITTQDSYTANKYVAAGILARFGDESNGAVVDITLSNCANAGALVNATYPEDVAQITPEYKKDDFKCNDSNVSYADYNVGVNKFVKTADAATVDAKVAAVAAAVPGDPTALDEALAPVLDFAAVDYVEGWEAFASARDAAILLTTMAASSADLAKAVTDLEAAILGLRSNANVDTTALEAAIAEGAKYENAGDKYTPATFAALTSALDAARKTLNAASQSKIDAAAAALTAALAALAEKPDTAALEAAITKYDAYVADGYVSTSWAPFADALAKAKAAKNNENSTKADVEAALAALNTAGEALVEKASTADLEAKVADINAKYNKDNYTAKSYAAVRSALQEADKAIKDGDVGADDIAAIVAALDAAVAGLLELGNFDEIDAILDNVDDLEEKNYTPETWAALAEAVEAIENAKKPASKGNISTADVADLKAALEAAVAGLVGYADFTELDALIASAEALVEADYTAESWAAVQNALKAAKDLKAKAGATAPEAKAALDTLKAAVDSLASSATEPAPTETDAPSEGGCGGVIGATAVVITAVVGLGVTVLKKKN